MVPYRTFVTQVRMFNNVCFWNSMHISTLLMKVYCSQEKLMRNKINNSNKFCKLSDKYKRSIEKPLLQQRVAN